MADFDVISRVGQEVRSLLWQGFIDDAEVRNIVGTLESILLDSPSEAARDSSIRLSVFLYQVTEDAYMKNAPMVPVNGQGNYRFPPLSLNLHYLVTPSVPDPDGNQLVLGKVMQIMYDTPTLNVADLETGESEPVRVILNRLTLEEHTRIWDALREAYKLSIAYVVRVPRVSSKRERTLAPVVEQNNEFAERD